MSKAPVTAIPHAFYIRPAPGWLDLLLEEVTALTQTPLQKYKYEPKVTKLKGTVKLHRCDWRQGLEVMLRLTTAHDVEWLLMESKCNSWSEVDAILKRVPWDDVFSGLDIPVHVSTDAFNAFSSSSAKLRENLCKIAGVMHVSEGGKLRFKIELQGDRLKVFVSLCGDPLYKRGYKASMAATAPLPEHQAAACVRWVLAGSKDETPVKAVYVPFAGSGTFGFEALIFLSGAGPGSFSREFSCDTFPSTPAPTMKFLRKKLSERLEQSTDLKVVFNDFNPGAISMLKENVAAFPSKAQFEILEGDMFTQSPNLSADGKVLALLNPPYGDRLAKDSSVPALYGRLGTSMRTLGKIHKGRMVGGCLCPDEKTWRSFLKELHAETPETHPFTHGGKLVRLVRWTA